MRNARPVPRWRRAAFMAAAALAAVALTGCDLVMTDLSAQSTEQWAKTYTLAPGGRVEVSNVNGRIEVEPADGNQVEVRAEKIGKGATDEAAKQALGRIDIVEHVSEGDVRIETKIAGVAGFNLGGTEVRYHLRVPAGTQVRVGTTNGAIKLDRLKGDITAETTNGAITGTGLSGRVKAGTTNGGIDMDLDAVGQGGVSLETTNGGVHLTIPRSTAADISARLANGSIRTADLDVQSRGETSRRRLDGTINGGGERIDVETTNGSITIRGK
jgi:DUF4097 and DUF4098 domain-containing protein YvlB